MIKNILLGLVFGFSVINLYAQEGLSFGIGYDWNEISTDEQVKIQDAVRNYISMLHSKDFDSFYNDCHSQLKTSTPKISFRQIGEMIAEAIPVYDSLSFINGKITKFDSPPKIPHFSVGGTLDKNDSNFIQFNTVADVKEQVLLIYRTKTLPIDRSIAIKLGLEDGRYKLIRFDINSCAFNNKDSKYYENLANEWKTKDSQIPYFFAIYLACRYNYLGQGIASHDFLKISDELKIIQSDTSFVNKVMSWNVNGELYDIINFDFTETKSDITPTIIYVSKEKLGEKSTQKEADKLFDWFQKQYPDLVNEFKVFLFQAYEEYPALPTKQYQYYRVIERID